MQKEEKEGGGKFIGRVKNTEVSQRYFILDEFQPVIPGNPRVYTGSA